MGILSGVGNLAGNVVGGLAGGAANAILKLAAPQLQGILGQLGGGQKMIDELVRRPIQEMLKAVDDGTWTGPGADAFKQELTRVFLPQATGMFGNIGAIIGALQKAQTVIESADSSAAGLVNQLSEQYKGIYKE
jgi:hypothetical protein